jgi:phage shock protein A
MALINRVSRLFKADFHAVLDQIEEPELLLKQAIRDMEDELAATEQRIILCASDQESLHHRKTELQKAVAEINEQLDLCFDSGKDDLAKSLIRKKLESERLLKHSCTKQATDEKHLAAQRAVLNENRSALESLRQKAELIAQRPPAHRVAADLDDISWVARELTVGDDEVEVAYLREKSIRSAS